jgi:hypothetical protein
MYRFDWSAGARPKASLAAVPIRASAHRYRLSIIVPEERAVAPANIPSPDFDTVRTRHSRTWAFQARPMMALGMPSRRGASRSLTRTRD